MKLRLDIDQANIHAIRTGTAAISELLAAGDLQDEDLDRAAQLLIVCRRARKELERSSTNDA